jgi:hypothetical protein
MAPEMGDKMRKQGVVCREPAYCFNIYHDPECKDKDIDVEIVGQPRESYIDGCWNKEDPNDWLTEIQVPVK